MDSTTGASVDVSTTVDDVPTVVHALSCIFTNNFYNDIIICIKILIFY